jgi:hypothetical protein
MLNDHEAGASVLRRAHGAIAAEGTTPPTSEATFGAVRQARLPPRAPDSAAGSEDVERYVAGAKRPVWTRPLRFV